MTRQDLTYNAWATLEAQRRPYTCEGVGAQGCDVERVGHFCSDEHASANGWDVSGLPVCPECCEDIREDMETILEYGGDYENFLARDVVDW